MRGHTLRPTEGKEPYIKEPGRIPSWVIRSYKPTGVAKARRNRKDRK